jgi:hypothetical protein
MNGRAVCEHRPVAFRRLQEVTLNVRQLALVGIAALAVGGTAVAQTAAPAPELTVGPAPTASPSAEPGGRRSRRRASTPEPKASPTDSPEPPQFQTMDGVWEVQLQLLDGSGKTIYSHLTIVQKADQLSGIWQRSDKSKYPFTGTFDGRLFKLVLTDAKGASYTMAGYAENYGDMVGLLTSSDPKDKGTPFTASHRKKDKGGFGIGPAGVPGGTGSH